jgi:hypothetical protein
VTESTNSFSSLLDNVSLEASQAFFDDHDNNDAKSSGTLATAATAAASANKRANRHSGEDGDDEDFDANNQNTNPLFTSRTYVKVIILLAYS